MPLKNQSSRTGLDEIQMMFEVQHRSNINIKDIDVENMNIPWLQDVFLPGHKIRIEIASSWFNRFDRNLQTGADNWMRDAGEPVIATHRVFHDEKHPSHIILPIIPAGTVTETGDKSIND